MKLSAASRDYVAKQVRETFGDDLRKAEKTLETARKALMDRYSAFERDLEKAEAAWMGDLAKLMARHGLHWAAGCGPENGAHVNVLHCRSDYYCLNREAFVETTDSRVAESEKAVAGVRGMIEEAVRKALFEIEVRGRKSDLVQIIEQVIKEARETKEEK